MQELVMVSYQISDNIEFDGDVERGHYRYHIEGRQTILEMR